MSFLDVLSFLKRIRQPPKVEGFEGEYLTRPKEKVAILRKGIMARMSWGERIYLWTQGVETIEFVDEPGSGGLPANGRLVLKRNDIGGEWLVEAVLKKIRKGMSEHPAAGKKCAVPKLWWFVWIPVALWCVVYWSVFTARDFKPPGQVVRVAAVRAKPVDNFDLRRFWEKLIVVASKRYPNAEIDQRNWNLVVENFSVSVGRVASPTRIAVQVGWKNATLEMTHPFDTQYYQSLGDGKWRRWEDDREVGEPLADEDIIRLTLTALDEWITKKGIVEAR